MRVQSADQALSAAMSSPLDACASLPPGASGSSLSRRICAPKPCVRAQVHQCRAYAVPWIAVRVMSCSHRRAMGPRLCLHPRMRVQGGRDAER